MENGLSLFDDTVKSGFQELGKPTEHDQVRMEQDADHGRRWSETDATSSAQTSSVDLLTVTGNRTDPTHTPL